MSTKTSDFPNWPKTANTALTAADVKSGRSSPEITTCYREAQKSEDLHNGSQDVSPDGRHHSAGGKSKSRRSLTERRNPAEEFDASLEGEINLLDSLTVTLL